jgi:hypothetical protein
MAQFYYTSSTKGSGDATSWDNTGSFANFVTKLEGTDLAAGDVVWLGREDSSDFTLASTINLADTSGTTGNPIVIRGSEYGGQRAGGRKPIIKGGRDNPWLPGGTEGVDVFQFDSTGSYKITGFGFHNVDACFKYNSSVNTVIIEDCEAENCTWFIENSGTGNDVVNLTVKRCSAIRCSKSFVRTVGDDDSDFIFVDCLYDGKAADGAASHTQAGFNIRGLNMARCQFIRCIARNAVAYIESDGTSVIAAAGTIQGDGFLTEVCTNVYFKNCIAENCSDSGYDTKAIGAVFDGCVSRNCRLGLKAWDGTVWNFVYNHTFDRMTALTPTHGANCFKSEDATYKLVNCRFINNEDNNTILNLDYTSDCHVELSGCVIEGAGKTVVDAETGAIYRYFNTMINGVLTNGQTTA